MRPFASSNGSPWALTNAGSMGQMSVERRKEASIKKRSAVAKALSELN